MRKNSEYEQVTIKSDIEEQDGYVFKWSPFLRQLLICSGLWTTFFVTGLSIGIPTVLIPQIRRAANSTAAVSDEMASWLSSVLIYSSIPWIAILPMAAKYFGRKIPFVVACLCSMISFTIVYSSNTTTNFMISQAFLGLLYASNITNSIIIITEYTSPQYRGLFLTIKSASFFFGIWVSNAIGTFYHTSNIGLFGLICSVSYLSVLIWPESPYWLASRGRFHECAKSHRWLKGTDRKSGMELEKLITSQKQNPKNSNDQVTLQDRLSKLIQRVSCPKFYKPLLLSVLMIAQYHASGKTVCCMYAIELIEQITKNERTAYAGMLILDGVTVLGMYFGCGLSKFLKRRTLLLTASSIGILFLFLMSLYLWLVEYGFIIESNIISLTLLAVFSVTISCGPMILCTSIYGELIPLRFKTSYVILTMLLHSTITGTSVKMAPFIFKKLSLHGAFLFYSMAAAFLTCLIYKFLPETKDKALQEIEEYFDT